MKKIAVCFFVLIILTGSVGCAKTIRIDDIETVTYSHPQGGYSIIIPKDWEKKLENKVSVGFAGNEPSVAFNVAYEIGGYDYHSMDKLAEELVSFLEKKMDNLTIISDSQKDDRDDRPDMYHFVAQGVLPGEQEVLLKGIILEPETGIRYYLLFTAGINDFKSLDRLFTDIAGTFKINTSPGELYQQLTGRDEEEEHNQYQDEGQNKEGIDHEEEGTNNKN